MDNVNNDHQLSGLLNGICNAEMRSVARAITLCESTTPADHQLTKQMLASLPRSEKSVRIAITGSPGAGKSSLLESIGMEFVRRGHKIGVLAIDPSSPVTGGSILGDKTRMTQLAAHPQAFVRPSPSRGESGGIARHTRETIRILEAAGYDLIFVETVGVGQGEFVVADIVDFFVYVALPNSGDDLQAVKRGILELVDMVVVNKCDGASEAAANIAKCQYQDAMSSVSARINIEVPVICCSTVTNLNIEMVCDSLDHQVALLKKSGSFNERRLQQNLNYFRQEFRNRLFETLANSNKFLATQTEMLRKIDENNLWELADSLTAQVLRPEYMPDNKVN